MSSAVAKARLPTNSQRFAQAIARADSYHTRFSTEAAREFFDGWSTNLDGNEQRRQRNDDDGRWRELPLRLRRLRERFESECATTEDPHRSSVSLTAAVMVRAPRSFRPSLGRCLREGLRRLLRDDDDDDDGVDHDGFWSDLRSLEWLPHRRFDDLLHAALRSAIEDAVFDAVRGDLDAEGRLDDVLRWKDDVLVPRVRDRLLTRSVFEDHGWDDRLSSTVVDAFCRVRIEHDTFDLVAEFPDSSPAVRDLAAAMRSRRASPSLRRELADALRDGSARRLVHPGAGTDQIVQMYVNTVRVLSRVDLDGTARSGGGGPLTDRATGPLRRHLRERRDTVRRIVTGLTAEDEDEGGDLFRELRRRDARPLGERPTRRPREDAANDDDHHEDEDDEDDDDQPPDPNWTPAPTRNAGWRGTDDDDDDDDDKEYLDDDDRVDVLGTLVSIYGSKEVFVNEYRLLLADRLLKNLDYDTNREVRNLELLKLRFGDVDMRQCEVMIKDLDDSRRIAANVRSTLAGRGDQPTVVDAAIASHIFWPSSSLRSDRDAPPHPRLKTALDGYADEYARLKNPRRLTWFHSLGAVELELDVVDEETGTSAKREFSCSPLQASAISYFEDAEEWSSRELATASGVAVDRLRGALSYWTRHRVLSRRVVDDDDDNDVYRLVPASGRDRDRDRDEGGVGATPSADDDDDHDDGHDDSYVDASASRDDEAMRVYESYVVGMLANLNALPLERIHNMLKMFVSGSDHRYDRTQQQLAEFLKRLCRENKIEYNTKSDGMYRLVRD